MGGNAAPDDARLLSSSFFGADAADPNGFGAMADIGGKDELVDELAEASFFAPKELNGVGDDADIGGKPEPDEAADDEKGLGADALMGGNAAPDDAGLLSS
eukprot:CCRYP_018695-RA/>CCRYP_018695-RA protein AED:0.28 eAED:0.28 QI:202/1/0.5/1/0/0/2/0/100